MDIGWTEERCIQFDVHCDARRVLTVHGTLVLHPAQPWHTHVEAISKVRQTENAAVSSGENFSALVPLSQRVPQRAKS